MNEPEYLSSLIEEVQNHYDVGPEFAKIYLSSWISGEHQGVKNLQDIMSLPDPLPIWFDFAMSTNQRGRMAVQILQKHIPTTARKYLDVGCGYGGFQIAFAELGMEVTGFEINKQLISLAEANCLDHNLRDCVYYADILDTNLVKSIGTFDVITCFDVIEHVLDAELALNNMISLLNPGGILALEIPNKDSISFVAKDGHFSLFGITLLKRPDAMEYYQSFYEDDYDVGEYYELSFYKDRLAELSCEINLLDSPYIVTQTLDFDYFKDKLLPGFTKYRKDVKKKLSPELQRKIQSRFLRYLYNLGIDHLLHRNKQDGKWLKEKYLVDFWTVLARKHTG